MSYIIRITHVFIDDNIERYYRLEMMSELSTVGFYQNILTEQEILALVPRTPETTLVGFCLDGNKVDVTKGIPRIKIINKTSEVGFLIMSGCYDKDTVISFLKNNLRSGYKYNDSFDKPTSYEDGKSIIMERLKQYTEGNKDSFYHSVLAKSDLEFDNIMKGQENLDYSVGFFQQVINNKEFDDLMSEKLQLSNQVRYSKFNNSWNTVYDTKKTTELIKLEDNIRQFINNNEKDIKWLIGVQRIRYKVKLIRG